MQIQVKLPPLAVFDTVISGVEGGIQYWADVLRWRVPTINPPADTTDPSDRIVCDIRDRDTGEVFSLQGKWSAALALMAQRYPRRFTEVQTESFDANTGDVLVQLAAFGELRYG